MESFSRYETVTSSKITLKDIAERAGVSVATVSNAFSGKGNLSSAKRDEILAIANELEYVPSPTAKALYKGNVKVAVLMPSKPKVLIDRFRAGFVRAMKKQPCTSMECTFFTYETVNEHFCAAAEAVIAGNYDGLIISYPNVYEERNAELIEKLCALCMPKVSMIGELCLFRSDAHIGIDAGCGGRLAADILGNIFTKDDGIAVFTADTVAPVIHKVYIDGFEKELEFYGMKIDELCPSCEHSELAYANAKKLFSQKKFPKGIFVTPYSAWAVADAARDAGVISNVRIIGVDTIASNVERMLSGDILAIIDQRQELQAERALTEVVHRILGDGFASEGTVTPNVVTRGKFISE